MGSALIVAVFALVGEGLSRIIRRVGRRAGVKDQTLASIRDVTRGVWIIIAIVGVAYYAKLTSDLTVLAVSTIGGLILSLALQATLSNVIAGLFMLEDGTLRVGDEVTYSGVSGRVIRIALRTSWIATDKGEIVSVSNSNLMGGPLTIRTATRRLVSRYRLEEIVPSMTKPDAAAQSASGKKAGAASGSPTSKRESESPQPPDGKDLESVPGSGSSG